MPGSTMNASCAPIWVADDGGPKWSCAPDVRLILARGKPECLPQATQFAVSWHGQVSGQDGQG
eukprot:515620-Prymnesium_polylepis.2